MTTALEFDRLSLGYDRSLAVCDVTTTVDHGSLTAVVGPNGAGKSTLLKALVGTLAPIKGQVIIDPCCKNAIGYLPQACAIDRSFPIRVLDIVAMGLWRDIGAFGRVGRTHKARVEEAIAAVGLTGFENRPIEKLSGGQMQRALFARLLLQDAQLLLLDEPFTAVDTKTILDLIEVIKTWQSEGRTILTVLHDDALVKAHFPSTMMIGRELVAHGATHKVFTKQNQFRARQICEGPPHHQPILGQSAA